MSDVQSLSPGAAADPAESRQSPRINVAWRARVLVSATQFIEGRALNASEQGLCLLLDQPFPVGSRLTTALAVPNKDDRARVVPVVLTLGVVFNVASGDLFKVGTQVLQVDEPGRQLIRHWVNKG